MKDVFAYWGCGKGLLKILHPHIRILSGFLVGCSCLLIPLQSIPGVILITIITVCWCLLAAMPMRMLLRCAIASIILFIPFFLIAPWIATDTSTASPMIYRFLVSGTIALRSTCCLFVTASTIAVLAIQDVHQGIAFIPMPRIIALLIVQLINQTMLLIDETTRIISVLRIRGASEYRNIRLLFSFPVVWMVRMLFRAERTAAAMTVRGYGIDSIPVEKVKLSFADMLMIFGTSAIFIIVILLRLRIFA